MRLPEGHSLTLCVALPHCETEAVWLEERKKEPLLLTVTDDEAEGAREGECVPLGLPLSEVLRETDAHALCEVLPHCDKDGVWHAEAQVEPLRLAVTEGDSEGAREGDGEPLGLPLSEAQRDTVAQALCEVLPH